MKMFCAPTDKTDERCQKAAEWGLLALLALFVSGGAGIFEISAKRGVDLISDALPFGRLW
jgi:hypothetical protein